MSSTALPTPLRRRGGYLTASDLLTTKLGDLFLLCRLDGDIDPQGGGGQGIYFRDTRFVDQVHLRLGARALKVVSAAVVSRMFSRIMVSKNTSGNRCLMSAITS